MPTLKPCRSRRWRVIRLKWEMIVLNHDECEEGSSINVRMSKIEYDDRPSPTNAATSTPKLVNAVYI